MLTCTTWATVPGCVPPATMPFIADSTPTFSSLGISWTPYRITRMSNIDFWFGAVTGCLGTLVVVALIAARILAPFMREAAKKSKRG